jgi:hypothetical protein
LGGSISGLIPANAVTTRHELTSHRGGVDMLGKSDPKRVVDLVEARDDRAGQIGFDQTLTIVVGHSAVCTRAVQISPSSECCPDQSLAA